MLYTTYFALGLGDRIGKDLKLKLNEINPKNDLIDDIRIIPDSINR